MNSRRVTARDLLCSFHGYDTRDEQATMIAWLCSSQQRRRIRDGTSSSRFPYINRTFVEFRFRSSRRTHSIRGNSRWFFTLIFTDDVARTHLECSLDVDIFKFQDPRARLGFVETRVRDSVASRYLLLQYIVRRHVKTRASKCRIIFQF